MDNTFIYADNAATTSVCPAAAEIINKTMTEDYANPSSKHIMGVEAERYVKEAAGIVASTLKCKEKEIIWTSGGTESNNTALIGTALAKQRQGKHIITTGIEHASVYEPLLFLESLGFEISALPVDETGHVILDVLRESLREDTILVSTMMVNNEIGTIEPIKELAAVAHRYGAAFHTDAVQGVGHIQIDVEQLDVDMLSASAHKFNGPKGIGFLYIRKGTSICPYNDGGSQEFGMRAGTENIAAIVGMAAALKSNCDHIAENMQHIVSMEERLIADLSGLDYVRNGASKHIPGNVSLSFADADGEAILHRMDLKGICISTGSACDSVNNQLSHVIEAIGVPEKYSRGTIRISIGKSNTMDEIHTIAEALRSIVKK